MVTQTKRTLMHYAIAALCASPVFAQVSVDVNNLQPGASPRPFGKYLVEVCTLNPEGTMVNCLPPSAEMPIYPGARQSIQIQQVCSPNSGDSCTPAYPVATNSDFYVSAASDSGLPVTQTIVAGSATSVAPATPLPAGTLEYHANGPGTVVIRATQDGDAQYSPAPRVFFVLAIGAPGGQVCGGLLPAPAARALPQIDAAGIVTLMGTPTPFTLVAQGKETILVYSARFPLQPNEEAVLGTIQPGIQTLLGRTADSLGLTTSTPFSVELEIPHAPALGDLATWIGSLNYSQFTVQDAGRGKVHINSTAQPDCDTWKAFLTDIRRNAWKIDPAPFDLRLYYLTAADVASALSPPAPAASSTPSPTPTPAPASAPTSPNATISVNQPPGSVLNVKSDTTPCVVAGLTLSNSSACAPPSSSGSSSAASSSSSGAGASSSPPPKASINSLGTSAATSSAPDLLVFSDSNPGDDAQINEQKRIIAQLDLARPEMIINAWVIQNSSTNPEAIGAFSGMVRDVINEANKSLEAVILKGWDYIKGRIAAGDYFNEDFYHYISDQYIADNQAAAAATNQTEAAQNLLEASPAKLSPPPSPGKLSDYGICESGRYCLGYWNLFQPLKPRLTDLLLALIAAKDPAASATETTAVVEGRNVNAVGAAFCEERRVTARERCRAIWKELGLSEPAAPHACDTEDLEQTVAKSVIGEGEQVVHLRCFLEATQIFMREADPGVPGSSPSGAGLLRSVVADFLFNYKMSQQYPHEFAGYDLSQSQDALDSALNPLIDAFNRDLATFQRFLRAEVAYETERFNRERTCCVKRLFGLDKPSFFNDGIVTVRTVSGQWTYVNTVSQSFLNASTAPTLSALASTVTGLNAASAPSTTSTTTSSTTATATPPPLLGAVLSANPLERASLLAGIMSQYQTTYAQIGRSLAISAIPRSLSTASAAEITVSLNADDSSGPTYYSGPQAGSAANISHVASHDTSTKVRVESVKLFEVSSLSAVIQQSRSRFPLVPPFVEIPYIGTLAGIPLPAAKEYHSSTAILSAMVAPTASDIAYGLRFRMDAVVYGAGGADTCSYFQGAGASSSERPCEFKRAVALGDLGKTRSVSNFNHAMVHCLATDMRSAYSGTTTGATNTCTSLSFEKIPQLR